MRNTKKIIKLATLFFALLLLAACKIGGGNSLEATSTPTVTNSPVITDTPMPTSTSTPSPTNTLTPTPTNTATPTPTEVVYLDKLDIKGVDFHNKKENSILHLMSIDYDVVMDNNVLGIVEMFTDGKGHIVYLYSSNPAPAGDEYVAYENSEFYLLFTSFEQGRIKVEKKEYLGTAQFCWIKERQDCFAVMKSIEGPDGSNREYIRIFDYYGKEYTSPAMVTESISGAIQLSCSYEYYYESDNATHAIRKVNIATGEKTEIDYPHNLYLKSFYGVSNIKGVDYLCGSFLGVDLKEYEGVINSETGEAVYIASEDKIGYINSGTYQFTINSKYSEESGIISTIFDGDRLITYSQDGGFDYSYILLKDKLVAIHADYESHDEPFELDDGTIYYYTVIDRTFTDIAIIDLDTSEIYASCRISTDSEKGLSSVNYLDDSRLLVTFSDQAGALDVYVWELDGGKYSEYDFSDATQVDVVEFTGFDNPEIKGRYTREDFIPGECPDYLKEEREYADQLEKKYDIKIHIADEAKCIMSGYVFEILNDKEKLRACLESMDAEFSKYPEGFFSLYKKLEAYPAGLELYFTGGLVGFEDGNLDRAGGLRTADEDSINIALDGYDGRYEAAVHHEISHSIEVLIKLLATEQLDEELWNGINIKYAGNRTYYANSYQHQDSYDYYGFKNNYKYTYKYMYYTGKGNKSQIVFMDDYSMTYPTEDRSRIFERIMWDGFDLTGYPALYEKYEYYCQIIRKMLTENGIDSSAVCYWEWLLKDDSANSGTEE